MTLIRKVHANFAETRIDSEVVLMRLDTGQFHTLKSTGLAVWDLIDGTRDRDGILAALAQVDDLEPEARISEQDRFLASLEGAGLAARD